MSASVTLADPRDKSALATPGIPNSSARRQSFRDDAPLCRVNQDTRGEHLCEGRHEVSRRGLEDSSNHKRFGPLYRSCCRATHSNGQRGATVGGASQPGGGPLRHRGRAFIRIATSFTPRVTAYRALSPGFHAWGRGRVIMNDYPSLKP
jgi:hypothetical protein